MHFSYLNNCVDDFHLPNLANTTEIKYLFELYTFFVLFFKSLVDFNLILLLGIVSTSIKRHSPSVVCPYFLFKFRGVNSILNSF